MATDSIPFVDVVFDAPPGPESGRFVEVENEHGKSVAIGSWIQRPDGYWVLRITENDMVRCFGSSLVEQQEDSDA